MTDIRISAPPGADAPAREARVLDLLGRMTLDEKLAQIVGFWEKADGEAVAPLQGEFAAPTTLGLMRAVGIPARIAESLRPFS